MHLRATALPAVVAILGCSKSTDQRAGAAAATSTPASSARITTGVKPACRADGRWHECSVLDRLDRAGLAPRRDSGVVTERPLSRSGILVRLANAELELFIYADEPSRAADEKRLDARDFVEAGTPYTMRHERTLIRSVNLLGLLKSLNEHQRERVADAITAGPPQATTNVGR